MSVDQQRQLGYGITDHQHESYSRKNIGYLYAIQHGARYIYDIDDAIRPKGGPAYFHLTANMSGLIYDNLEHDDVNPYGHFGQPFVWPRGYSLQDAARPVNNTYKLTTFATPAIQQALVDGDTDVDAIFGLLHGDPKRTTVNITFDRRAPPMVLPRGVFAPLNSHNTLFAYSALWALYLPSSVTSRVSDIWRGYWAQTLLWLLGQRIAFLPPNAVRSRHGHRYIDDFHDESELHQKTTSLIRFLKKWKCRDRSFFSCVSRLGHDMAAADFWRTSDAAAIDAWLLDLRSFGYEEPSMAVAKSSTDDFRRVYFSSNLQNLPSGHGWSDMRTICEGSMNLGNLSVTSRPSFTFDKLLLVIVFNSPYHQNIGVLEALYRDHFPNMVYCSQVKNYDRLLQDIAKGPIPLRVPNVSFINITSAGGYFGYECPIRAIEMNYGDLDGYVILGDDVLFNFWNLNSVPDLTDSAHIQSPLWVNRTLTKIGWQWWPLKIGKQATDKAFAELEAMALKDVDPTRKGLFREFLENRKKVNLTTNNISRGVADFYHIPRGAAPLFAEVARLFLKHQVFLEIAVPTITVSLHPRPFSKTISGKSLWGGKPRSSPIKFFDPVFHYLHPLKLTKVSKDPKFKQQYCNVYVNSWFTKF